MIVNVAWPSEAEEGIDIEPLSQKSVQDKVWTTSAKETLGDGVDDAECTI